MNDKRETIIVEDPLAMAKGCAFALLLSLPFWIGLAIVIWKAITK
jgi:hypothetical protein